MSDNPNPAEAERLKVQGNELYQKGEHEAAHHKYSEAIKKDPGNAVLWANRAATLLARKEYMDAAYDCKKATELDPTYSKAWGRYGVITHASRSSLYAAHHRILLRLVSIPQALAAWPECIKAWQAALDTLPKTALTPAQKVMKVQFEEGLAKAKSARTQVDTRAIEIPRGAIHSGKLPWDIAETLRPKKMAEKKVSCVYVLVYAHHDFKEGKEALDSTQTFRDPTGKEHRAGQPKVLTCLSNAILTDERVFYLTDPEYFEKVRQQSNFENMVFGGWASHGGPAAMKEESVQRLKESGWNAVRPAISITIRVWVYHAFMRNQLLGHQDLAHELYTRALDVLEWGRKQWPNVSKDDRGVVFEKSFIRGIKRLQLQGMHAAVHRRGDDAGFTCQDLMDRAKDLIEDVASDPIDPRQELHLGHFLAYWTYPRAVALSTLGWCHLQIGVHAPEDAPPEFKRENFKRAGGYYRDAAEAYPEDDESHPTFLCKYLECMCLAGEPLKVTLAICKRIRTVKSQALEIWDSVVDGGHLRNTFEQATEFETKYLKEISEGKRTMESTALLPPPRKLPAPTMASVKILDD